MKLCECERMYSVMLHFGYYLCNMIFKITHKLCGPG